MIGVIYSFTHAASGRRYIGQTVVLQRRKAWHLLMLGRGKHTSPALQALYDQDGEGAFRWEVVEECDAENLTPRAPVRIGFCERNGGMEGPRKAQPPARPGGCAAPAGSHD